LEVEIFIQENPENIDDLLKTYLPGNLEDDQVVRKIWNTRN